MELTETDRQLIGALRDGLPLAERPYEALGNSLGLDEADVIDRMCGFVKRGMISRIGVVVDHAALGFDSNAMVVWNIPDEEVERVGAMFAGLSWVSLCYQRPRRLPDWPYNLFTMIHARDRAFVEDRVAVMATLPDVMVQPPAILHTTRRFKQTAACYGTPRKADAMDEIDRRLIDRLQDGFPLDDRPFRTVAEELGLDEDDAIVRVRRLRETGVLTRFGPLYHAERMGGALLLAALKVPPEEFERIATLVNELPEVAHNYARGHAFNMWFVLATETPEGIYAAIAEIERRTGLTVHPMPKLAEYFVGLRFAV